MDDTVNYDPAGEAEPSEGGSLKEGFLRERRLEGNPFEPFPLHRLLAHGRDRQALADPALRELVERGWDARVMVHLTCRANTHPGNRENLGERYRDYDIDANRLKAIEVKIGERVLAPAGVAPPGGLRLVQHEEFLRGVGSSLLRTCYCEGCDRIERSTPSGSRGSGTACCAAAPSRRRSAGN